MPIFSSIEGFFWLRFPLFAIACQSWILKNFLLKRLFIYMLGLSFLLMCLILTLEILIDIPKTRLSWPYGDLVPGSFLAKSCLPFFITCFYYCLFSKNLKLFFTFSILICLNFVFTYLTGERMSLIILILTSAFLILILKLNLKNFYSLLLFLFLSIFVVSLIKPNAFQRLTKNFLNDMPLTNFSIKNSYWGAWRTGIQQGLENPLFGVGPSGTRYHCSKLEPYSPNGCPVKITVVIIHITFICNSLEKLD